MLTHIHTGVAVGHAGKCNLTFPLCAGMVGALGSARSSPESVATGEAPSPDLMLVQHQ